MLGFKLFPQIIPEQIKIKEEINKKKPKMGAFE